VLIAPQAVELEQSHPPTVPTVQEHRQRPRAWLPGRQIAFGFWSDGFLAVCPHCRAFWRFEGLKHLLSISFEMYICYAQAAIPPCSAAVVASLLWEGTSMNELAPYSKCSNIKYRPMASCHRDRDPWLLTSGALKVVLMLRTYVVKKIGPAPGIPLRLDQSSSGAER
jgi:hypothetical protein